MEPDVDALAEVVHQLVDRVIDDSLSRLNSEMGLNKTRSFERSKEAMKFHEPPTKEQCEVANIEWLKISEFSIDNAIAKLHEFIKTWSYEDSWFYCIDFIQEDERKFDVRYRFRVRWSIPTRRRAIPRATASVYFTFVVSKTRPTNFPVEVLYVFETNQLVHKPGHSLFREKWLKDIIESKVLLMDSIVF